MADLQGRALCEALFDAGLLQYCHCSDDATVDDVEAREVRAEIERRGLQSEFILELNRVIQMNWSQLLIDVEWTIINASPEQQCRAALKAVEGAHA